MLETLTSRVRSAQKHAPVDLEGLASSLGLKVNYAYLPAGISGELVSDNGSFSININAGDPPTRQRFTLAHEIGHYVRHRDLIGTGLDDDRAYRSTNQGRYFNTRIGPKQETEANKFAANLLMPWDLIEEMQEAGLNRSQIAGQLGVSEHAMAIRLGEPYP
ncbi:ImmA/IrrE family metallo-endopeptidase [Roseivivax sp. GX 12232]|uniref:ImmA/IrrE family metallo-endopeptidase n=1 Tax=Roseivivax sp. GX 12232 TaxID=2900547 RepID=UPI001E50B35E|nr:ImmA/IrrE family metallo-endopeptidase [Roseivivax sp. GX 12232]MCE0504187.1 ImmA/IrrE family metallo-endopeptidase [Roseivivax sp. GX 12232]